MGAFVSGFILVGLLLALSVAGAMVGIVRLVFLT